MKDNQDFLNLLRKVNKNPSFSQRKLADELGFSLGKLNYCLKALKSKGLIKIENFKKNPNKLNYIYVLTPKGITEKSGAEMVIIENSQTGKVFSVGSVTYTSSLLVDKYISVITKNVLNQFLK